MKLTIETVYENVTEEWYQWWLSRFPKEHQAAAVLRNGNELAEYSSIDPTSNVFAITTYRIEKEDGDL